ncbi:hypothetical protein [Ferrigenium kumadai]|uniref:hypothetical protein n=1 Tax=Ferrigenium kumadai TaxID=1682490 RepID=UPI001BB4214A|nr:hypothetical protein [Ferrigenium kumadai]
MGYYSLEPPISKMLSTYPSPLLVQPDSPRRIREFVEVLGKHFRRELQFDSVPFEAAETPDSLGYVPFEVYLFHEVASDLFEFDKPVKHRCIGACGFRWYEWSDAPASWSLQWVWFHPYFRGRGHLSKAWPHFIAKYGEFHVQYPVSAAMEKFLEKHPRTKSV